MLLIPEGEHASIIDYEGGLDGLDRHRDIATNAYLLQKLILLVSLIIEKKNELAHR